MKQALLITICFFFAVETSHAQNNDAQAFFYNVGTNALIGGIGAVINKKKDQKLSTIILKGIGQGALGGYLVFESKRMLRQFSRTENYGLLWPSKIINAAGNSITLNAAENRDFWERWYLNIGFNHIEYDIRKDSRWSYRILPFSLISAFNYSFRGKLDVEKSLWSGNFVFKSKSLGEFGALAFANNVIYNSTDVLGVEEIALAHEIIHVYQYEGWIGLRGYFNKPNTIISIENELITKYNKHFFSDWNYLVLLTKITSENLFVDSKWETPTEQEAFFWTDDFRNPHN